MGTEPMIKKLNASAISELPEQQTRIAEYSPERLSIQRFFFTDDSGVELTPSPSWNGAYIEVSMPMPDGSRKSKKFDFGKFLTYLQASLETLAKQSMGNYLTEERARDLFIPFTGNGESKPHPITGPLVFSGVSGAWSIVADKGIQVANGTVEAPTVKATTALESTTTTTLNNVTVKAGLDVQSGNFKVSDGTTELDGTTTINGNLVNRAGAADYTASFNKIDAVNVNASTLNASTTATAKDLIATGDTSVRRLTVDGDAVFNRNATVASTGKFVVNGNVYLDNRGDDSYGKIIAGDTTKSDPFIQGRTQESSSEIYISKATIDAASLGIAIVGSEGTTGQHHTLVLEVKGDMECIGDRTTATMKNIDVIEKATFESQVQADSFLGHDYSLIDTHNASAGLSDGGGKTSGAKPKGLWQTIPQIAELTAKAACWS